MNSNNPSSNRSRRSEPNIWAARSIEWPIPTSLSVQQYNRLTKASRQAGAQLGITPKEDTDGNQDTAYFSGFMSRLATAPQESSSGGGSGGDAPRPLRPPRPGCVAAANGWIVAALECPGVRVVSRWNVRRGGVADHWVALPPPTTGNGRLAHVFVDPTASHTLLSAVNGEAYYLHTSGANKPVVKLTGFGDSNTNGGIAANTYVTSVAWDKERGTEGTSKRILLGTSAGEIYEYTLGHDETTTSSIGSSETLPRLLQRFDATAVTGLHFERLRTGLLVLAATSGRHKPTRFYTFYSPHSSSFAMVMQQQQSLVELPGSIDFADLRFCGDHFALRTQSGIYYGTIDRSAVVSSSTAILIDSGILPYPSEDEIPVALALTPHHILTLTQQHELRFCNRVSQQIIQTEHLSSLEEDMTVGEFLLDIRRPDQVWLRKGRSLVHISASQEDRDVWKYTLQKGLTLESPEHVLEQAKSLCTNQAQKAVVTAVRAEHHLGQGRAELGAKYLAQCPPNLKPFADTAVRLALLDSTNKKHGKYLPLITYLNDKMRVARMKEDRIASTMLGAWLTELLLHDGGDDDGRLAQFLNANLDSMDAKTILKLLASHDVGAGACATFAAQSGDLSTAVNAALSMGGKTDQNSGAMSALLILNDAPFELAEPLYYKHALLLLSRVPSAAGDSFLSKYEQGLSPLRLLPSLVNYERMRTERARVRRAVEASQSKSGSSSYGGGVEESKSGLDVQVGPVGSSDGFEMKLDTDIEGASSFVDDSSVLVKYLEGVIRQGCRSSAIYSYLISLFVKLEDEEPLLAFLTNHISSASTLTAASKRAMLVGEHFDVDESGSVPLDMSYALRAVLGTGRHFRSAIKLYMGFGMRQQAVELALKVDPSLARELAQDSVELEERKRLWLMIAKHAASDGSVRGRDVVSRVVAVLKDCGPDVLSIEDVLPFLPDFTRIDEIKDEICDALTSYSTKIDSFLKEMSNCDQTCDKFRKEISRLRNHQMHLRSDARCALSNKMVLGAGEPFYVFPSGYVFLESALKEVVMPCLNDKQQQRVTELENELRRFRGDEKDKMVLQQELDGLVAAECPLTGSVMVESIDKDFDDSEEYLGSNDSSQPSLERVDV